MTRSIETCSPTDPAEALNLVVRALAYHRFGQLDQARSDMQRAQFANRRPFFSMKLVNGQTLSMLLADREHPSDERGKLLGVFEHVCQTMAEHGR